MLIKEVTGTVIEKTKSEPFHKIKGKVKLSFYYQIECFYLFTTYSYLGKFQKRNIITYFFFLNFIVR
ncbi:hypothetical protein M109_1961 [Bacteroides fragilis str. 3397 N2]|nr:hypothetical protein M109_1961 [Bacteroides fragilis str. 3397 N2]EXZ54306.1 hypothetical protein M108_1651 [Bacteroides fragilis str. 3397 T14]EYA44199.1 hypothetical protein M110_1712 [Bacteroides fragilis str. 3397 N3]